MQLSTLHFLIGLLVNNAVFKKLPERVYQLIAFTRRKIYVAGVVDTRGISGKSRVLGVYVALI